MSTKKITALTELAAAPAATDMIPVVDVSDTTDASSGTTKKITATNIAKGVGIGAGNTNAEPLNIDTTNGRVGIGVSSMDTDFVVYSDDAGVSAEIKTVVAGAGAGDPFHTFLVNGVFEWAMGVDNSDSDSFKINSSGLLGASGGSAADRLTITTSGNVGIGTASPTEALHVGNGSGAQKIKIHSGTGSSGEIIFGDDAEVGLLQYEFGTNSLRIQTAAAERARIDSAGNVLIGGTATPTSSSGNLCLFNGNAPAASVTNGVVLYAEDVSTSELKVRDEAGNIATISPHNFELLGDRSEEMAWSYSCKNAFAGKEVAVDMTKVIRALEKLTGEEYIKIRDIANSEKLDWDEEEKRKEAEQKANIDAYKDRKAKYDSHPTNSSTKAAIKTFLDDKEISYEDASKAELLKLVPEKGSFNESEPTAYTKKSKPDWLK